MQPMPESGSGTSQFSTNMSGLLLLHDAFYLSDAEFHAAQPEHR